MSVEFAGPINWDGKCLSVFVESDAGRILCVVPRDVIHFIPLYRDIIEREIDKDRQDIFDRLKEVLSSRIDTAIKTNALGPIELCPRDVEGQL